VIDPITLIKAAFLGIIEGLTEFLPVSSTGHLIIANQFVHFDSQAFGQMFDIVIQLGAILAVVAVYWKRLNPFSKQLTIEARTATWNLWGKAVAAFIPTGIGAFLLANWVEKNFFNATTVAATLIFYGVLFLVVEFLPKKVKLTSVDQFPYWLAVVLGAAQLLSIVPGTSRSGITILAALVLGAGRVAAAEFTFFLAIPTMAAATCYSLFKYLKTNGWGMTLGDMAALAVGFVASFFVAWWVVRAFIHFLQKRTFVPFGLYRIVLGVVVLAYFAWSGAAIYH